MVVSNNLNDLYPAVLTCKAGANGNWQPFELKEGWDLAAASEGDVFVPGALGSRALILYFVSCDQ